MLVPIQSLFLPELENYAALIFLPHGVRVLTAWLYGWRSLLLLAPSALLTHSYLYGSYGFSIEYFFAALFGIFCATLSFWVLSKMGLEFRYSKSEVASWRQILIAGGVASLINVVGTSTFYGFDSMSSFAYFIGDLGGLLAMLVILMMWFRLRRYRA